MLSLDAVLSLVDDYASNDLTVKKNTDESNIITTYKKYFL